MVSYQFILSRLTHLFLTLIIVLGLASCSPIVTCSDALGCVTISPSQSLTIGVAVPLTGPDRAAGDASLAAIQAEASRVKTILGHGIHIQQTDFNCSNETSQVVAARLTGDETLTGVIAASCVLRIPASQRVFKNSGVAVITQADQNSTSQTGEGILQVVPKTEPVNPMIDTAFSAQAADALFEAISQVSNPQPDGSLLIPRKALENRLQLSIKAQ